MEVGDDNPHPSSALVVDLTEQVGNSDPDLVGNPVPELAVLQVPDQDEEETVDDAVEITDSSPSGTLLQEAGGGEEGDVVPEELGEGEGNEGVGKGKEKETG